MLRARGYADHRAGDHAHRFLALGLVPAGAGRAHEDLIATASCAVVDVPVVATSRFEAHVADRDAPCDERGQITPSDEVLREGLVGIAEREGLLELVLRHASLLRHRCQRGLRDRKSTRLNSSHVAISYAVFCLKKKNI